MSKAPTFARSGTRIVTAFPWKCTATSGPSSTEAELYCCAARCETSSAWERSCSPSAKQSPVSEPLRVPLKFGSKPVSELARPGSFVRDQLRLGDTNNDGEISSEAFQKG